MTESNVIFIDKDDIPVIDIGSLFSDRPDYSKVGQSLLDAAQGIGFFYVKNHSIPEGLMTRVAGLSKRFFAYDENEKQSVRAQGTHRGLLGFGGAKMAAHFQPDLKESFIWGADLAPDNPNFVSGNKMFAPNVWPEFMPELSDTLNEYMAAANHCGFHLLKAFAAGLDIDEDYFVHNFDQPISRGTLIHYPSQGSANFDKKDDSPPQYGVSPHTDFGTLTLLAQDDTGGLQVRGRNGKWLTAHPIANTLVVNVGDLLARWTNDRFQSTVHAVVNRSGRERYSIVVAVDPNWETEIKPVVFDGERPNYEPVTCGEYIQGRFDRSFSYQKPTKS